MKRMILRGTFFILLTLLTPLILTWLFSRNALDKEIPDLDDIRIYTSSNAATPITLEDYVTGVVLASIPTTYEYETLKAQAVIVRTYALKNIITYRNQSNLDMILDQIDPHSSGYTVSQLGLPYIDEITFLQSASSNCESFLQNVTKAVKETAGEVIIYDHQLIYPLYFALSAGTTRNSCELWSEEIPYLISTDSSQDVESPDYLTILPYDQEDAIQMLQTAYEKHLLDVSDYDYQVYPTLPLSIDNLASSLTITARDSAGYVTSVAIGDISVTGDAFANALNLPSSFFSIDINGDQIRFICNGKGHGIGFSQYGANVLVLQEGYTYLDVLTYYYYDVTITTLH